MTDPIYYITDGDEPWEEDSQGNMFTEEEYVAMGQAIYLANLNQSEYMAGRVLDWALNARIKACMLEQVLSGELVIIGLNDDDKLMFALRTSFEENMIPGEGDAET